VASLQERRERLERANVQQEQATSDLKEILRSVNESKELLRVTAAHVPTGQEFRDHQARQEQRFNDIVVRLTALQSFLSGIRWIFGWRSRHTKPAEHSRPESDKSKMSKNSSTDTDRHLH
jgi:hypothetical protein